MAKLRHIILSLAILLLVSAATGQSLTYTSFPTFLSSTPYPTATYSPTLATAVAKGECLQSFDTFSYQAPLDRSFQTKTLLPNWQIETTIPAQQVKDPLNQVKITRSINGQQEIWISLPQQFAIYQPKGQGWEHITTDIGDTDLFVDELFVTSDAIVWGRTTWNSSRNPIVKNIPVLSKFNETTRRFELVDKVVEIPLDLKRERSWGQILLDKQDTFWIVVEKDGIYRYDPAKHLIEKQAELPGDFELSQAVSSPDGSIYLAKNEWAGDTLYRLSNKQLFQYSPKTKKIEALTIPNESWPVFSGLLVDRQGRLWLGAIGYRNTDGMWHLIHPHPEEFFDVVDTGSYSYVWASPFLMLESSDGILWYRKFLDTSGWAEGTAWYNPKTGEGCLFTNQAANIVEDSQQQLWLVADGKLYKHQLKP